jgi:hypothetical protein
MDEPMKADVHAIPSQPRRYTSFQEFSRSFYTTRGEQDVERISGASFGREVAEEVFRKNK